MNRKLFGAFLTFLLIAIIALIGCSNDDDNGNGNSEPDYFPLELGNEWIFQVTQVDSTGTKVYEAIQTLDHMTAEDTIEWFVLIEDEDTFDTLDSTYYRKDEYLLQGIFFDGGARLPVTVSPLEPVVGVSWDTTGLVTIYGEVLSQESITVDAGTFDCYKEKLVITSIFANMTIYNWLADGIGPVRILILNDPDSTDTKDMQLSSYTIQ